MRTLSKIPEKKIQQQKTYGLCLGCGPTGPYLKVAKKEALL